MAADLVVEHVAPHARARLRDERVLEPPAEPVVVDDEKLHEHVIARLLDALEDRAKRRLAVDEQLRVIAARRRELREFFQQRRARRLRLRRRAHREKIARELPLRVAHLRLDLAPEHDVTLEARPPENPIRRHRDIRKRVQRHRPRDRALRGSHVEDRVDGSQRAEQMAERDDERAPRLAMFPQPEQRRTGARKAGGEFCRGAR